MKNKFAKTAALSIITALTVTGGVYSPLYAAMTKESVKLYKSAQKFESQNRFKDAIDLMEKALATSPDDITLNTKLAGLYSQTGQYDKALEVYQKTLRLKPDDGFLYISIGNLLEQKNDYENALYSYKEALSIMPDYKYNYLNIANVEYILKDC